MDKDEWNSAAYKAFCRWALRQCKPFTMEEARAKIRVEDPADLRWWGAVVKGAHSAGVIRPVSFRSARSSHGSLKPTWIGIKS